MMYKFRRFLAVLTSCMLMFTSMPVSVLADTFDSDSAQPMQPGQVTTTEGEEQKTEDDTSESTDG